MKLAKVPKLRIPKVLRNIMIAVSMLLLTAVVGGMAYTYYLGPDASQMPAPPPPPPPTSVMPKAPKPAANRPASASVQSLSSPVAPGDNASLTVRTVPTASCTIAVTYGAVAAKDSGLTKKTADEYGMVTWAWTIDDSAPLGTWPVKVTCAYNGKTAVVQGDLVVAAADDASAQ